MNYLEIMLLLVYGDKGSIGSINSGLILLSSIMPGISWSDNYSYLSTIDSHFKRIYLISLGV